MATREKARLAATLTLLGFAGQLIGAVLSSLSEFPAAWSLAAFAALYLLTGYAAYLLKSRLAVAAAVVGALLACWPSELLPVWIANIVINLLYLAMYLPMQRAFDSVLYEADVSQGTLTLGRCWAIALLIGRCASTVGFLPMFEGQAEISAAQGAYTQLFNLQLISEIIALIAAFVSYICMVRYLWRARGLLQEDTP